MKLINDLRKSDLKKKILYLTTWDYANSKTDGVCRKIDSEIMAFEEAGYDVDKIYVLDNEVRYVKNGYDRVVSHVGRYKKTATYMKLFSVIKNENYDWVYNRYGMLDPFYQRVLKRLKHNGAGILLEVPTYPYKWERNKGFLNWLMFYMDHKGIRYAHRYIDRIVTYSDDNTIWGIPTIRVINGIDVSAYKQKGYANKRTERIDLIAIALMQPYHGYERMIRGLYEYYNSGDMEYKVYFHMVGDGPELEYYKKLVSDYELENYVLFYGRMNQEQIAKSIDNMDIAVCSLGTYKKKVFRSSELKSREYLARGIPFVFACDLDIEDELNNKMALKFANDDSIIDISEIIGFYKRIKDEYMNISNRMHDLACNRLDMSKTMEPIIEYMGGLS